MNLELLADLNPAQREAALCRGHCVVVAIPGSGKTKTLASKTAFALSDSRAKVVAVTFTRDSAVELRERIVKIAGHEVLPQIIVGTYHSVALLMAFPSRVKPGGMGSNILCGRSTPFKQPWVVSPEGHRRSFVARAIKESGLASEFEDAMKIIESGKGDDKLLNTPEKKRLVQIYNDLMQRHGCIDFQDIILKTNSALADGSLAPLVADMLLLDEYQDTDQSQYAWAAHHARAGVSVTAVGDDDQSIYGFRKALGYQGMELFKQQFRAETIVLGVNYRSHEEVLSAATALVKHNTARVAKDASTYKGYGGHVEWEGFTSRTLEAQACALVGGQALNDGLSFAVLARTSGRLDAVEASMIMAKVPFVRKEGESILNHRECAIFSAIVESLFRPGGKAADEAMAWAGVSESEVTLLHELSTGRIQPLNSSVMIKAGIEAGARSAWNKFCKMHSDWTEAVNANYDMSTLLVRLGIQEFLIDSIASKTDKRSLSRIEMAYGLFECGAGETLEQRIKSLDSANFAEKAQQKKNVAQLMTAHGSKGLEFDSVWIVGAEEEAFPHKDSSCEEERRLFYVAMTRAKKNLVISKSGKKSPSRFIYEANLERAPMGKYETSEN